MISLLDPCVSMCSAEISWMVGEAGSCGYTSIDAKGGPTLLGDWPVLEEPSDSWPVKPVLISSVTIKPD